jgi:hypothetical protein
VITSTNAVLVLESGTLRLRAGGPSDEAIAFANETAAAAWLRRAWASPGASASLRGAAAMLAGQTDPTAWSDHEILERVARALARRQLTGVVARAVFGGPPTRDEAAASTTAAPALTWIELSVYWDHADEPVGGVDLAIELADGTTKKLQTRSDGTARLDGIRGARCDVRCDLAGVHRDAALHVVGEGEHPLSEAGGPPSSRARKPPKYSLARVTAHRARTGETLDSIARAAGLTWQSLAEFNWGTTSPKGINDHLRAEVGCTKKTHDGKNYRFDDDDHPGLVFVPSTYVGNFATGDTHRIRVMQHRFVYLLYDEHRRFPLPFHEYLLYDDEKHVLTGESDAEGRVMLDHVPARWHIDVIGPGPSHPFWTADDGPEVDEPAPPAAEEFEDDGLTDELGE